MDILTARYSPNILCWNDHHWRIVHLQRPKSTLNVRKWHWWLPKPIVWSWFLVSIAEYFLSHSCFFVLLHFLLPIFNGQHYCIPCFTNTTFLYIDFVFQLASFLYQVTSFLHKWVLCSKLDNQWHYALLARIYHVSIPLLSQIEIGSIPHSYIRRPVSYTMGALFQAR